MTEIQVKYDGKVFSYSNVDTMLFCTKSQIKHKKNEELKLFIEIGDIPEPELSEYEEAALNGWI